MRAGLPRRRLDQVSRPMVPALAPGRSGRRRGRLVIVFGPAGAVSGVFVYEPGTAPSKGNPPIAWMTGGSEDPYGNPVEPTIGTENNTSGLGLQLQGAQLIFTGAGSAIEGYLSGQMSSGPSTAPFIFATSPTDGVLTSQLLLFGESSNGAAQPIIIMQGLSSGTPQAVTFQLNGTMAATEPGSTALDNPGVPEPWHAAALSNAAGSGNGVNGAWYRISPDGSCVELAWDIAPSAGAGSTFMTLPTPGYRIATDQDVRSGWSGTGPAAYTSTFHPYLLALTTGAIQYQGTSGLVAGFSMFGYERLPLAVL